MNLEKNKRIFEREELTELELDSLWSLYVWMDESLGGMRVSFLDFLLMVSRDGETWATYFVLFFLCFLFFLLLFFYFFPFHHLLFFIHWGWLAYLLPLRLHPFSGHFQSTLISYLFSPKKEKKEKHSTACHNSYVGEKQPWNTVLTLPVQSSAKIQPSDQTSIFLSYGSPKMTSGAR